MEPPQVCVFQVPFFEFFEQNFQMPKKCGCLSAWPVLPVMIYEMANLNKLKISQQTVAPSMDRQSKCGPT